MSDRAFHIRLPSPPSAKRSTSRWQRASQGRAERLGDFGTVAERAVVRRSEARGGAGAGEGALGAIEGQLLEVEYEGSFRRILRVDEQALGGPDTDGMYALPPSGAAKQRGGGTPTAVRVLEWAPGADILEHVAAAPAGKAGIAAIRAMEQRWVEPGAYHATDPAHPAPLSRADTQSLTGGSAPTLLLLHGTFSNPSAAFRDLAGTPEWDRIRARYGDRIIAYGHRTMSESPVKNATDLLEYLGRSCELHLLTHSRGGLVGELLLQSEWNHPAPEDLRELGGDFLALTEKLGAKTEEHRAEEVEELRRELTAFREAHARVAPRITRFVRVACPAAGTALAGPRLHKFLSAVLSGIGVVSGWGNNPLYAFIRAVCLDIVSRGTTEGDLPGLAAMSPGRPFVKLLASSDAIASPLTIVAGDVEGKGLLGKAAVLATDLFFRTDHDLVVNTPSMYAGATRAEKPEEIFYRGPSVTHFSYFEDAASRGSICEALLGTKRDAPRSRRAKSAAPPAGAATVFLLPGVGGSRLGIGAQEIWVNYFRLIFGGIARLASGGAPSPRVEVLGWDDSYYADLHAALSPHFHVVEHPFDWRLSIAELGAALAARLGGALDRGGTVHVLGHSMGGLVARAALADAALRARFVAGGGRVLMLGTPNGGSVSALQMLTGDDALAQRIARWDVTHDPKEIQAFLCAFPGLVGLVPLEILEEQPALLRGLPAAQEAIAAWKAIAKKSELDAIKPLVRYVAGVAEHTPKSARCDGETGAWTYEWSRRGDGRVLHSTGVLDPAHTWYVDAVHGDLPRAEHAYPAYVELLRDGSTDRLSQTPPGIRGHDGAPPAPDAAQSESLVDAMLGGAGGSKRSAAAAPLRITVRHGDLAESELPVLVGHYRGDALTSSDRAVDERLGGALRRRLERGLLPSEPGTAEVIYGSSGSPDAVVVGLGAAGSLDRRTLVQCFRAGLLAFATAAAERKTPPKLTMSTVAIGASDLSLLSAAAVVQSFAEAAVRTNRALRASRAECFRSLELVELYADRAIELGHAVRELERTMPLALREGETIAPASAVRRGIGYRGARPHAERGGAWASFAVERAEPGKLRFQIATDGPRTDITEVEIDVKSVGSLWDAIDQQPRDATALAGRFAAAEVPRAFRAAIGRGRDVLLTVDRGSAEVPWELVAFTDRGWTGRPEAVVRHGLIRRIASGEERARDPIASNRSVLVIGDPVGSELPGARAEAQRVLALFLEAEWDASAAIAESGEYTQGALTAHHGGYRALHIAAHGGFDEGGDSFVDLGDELSLRSESLLTWDALPELVFLNCCYTGAIKAEPLPPREQTRHGAHLAAAFLERGVRAFVAAGWAVDDGAARLFAERFYASMLAGEAFGRAVDHARRATQLRYPEDSTWAAYQCYGDPEYRLLRTHDEAAITWVAPLRDGIPTPANGAGVGLPSRSEDPLIAPFVAQTEAEDEVGTLMGLLRSRPPSARDELGRRLERLTQSIERHQWRDGELLRKLAGVYRELGDLKGALRFYDRALDALDGHAAIKVLVERAETDSRAGYANGDDEAQQRAIDVARGFETVLAGLGRVGAALEPMRARLGRLIAGAQLRLAARRESGWEACLEEAWTHFAAFGGGAHDADAWATSAAAVLSAPTHEEAARSAPLPLDVLEWRVDRLWLAWLLGSPPPEPLDALLRLAGDIRGPGSRSDIARAEIVALALAVTGSEDWAPAIAAYEAAIVRRAGRYREDLAIERLECFLTLAARRGGRIDPALLSTIAGR